MTDASDWTGPDPADDADTIGARRLDALAASPEHDVDWFRAQLLSALDGWEATARELAQLKEGREDY